MSNHFENGKAVMVDVSNKADTLRVAVAEAFVRLPEAALQALQEGGAGKGDTGKGDTGKGDAIAVAELAGIMAAKRTSDLIPLCHPLPLTKVAVAGALEEGARRVRFTATCKTTAPTGVEMEALTAVSVACLTLYDMLKGRGKGIIIEEIRLLRKEGGKSGLWEASFFARPLTPDDEDVLAPVDAAYARRFGLEPLVSRASLSFYVRSGHAFVGVRSGREVGFAFAQAVWNGARPTVYLNRLAVLDSDDAVDDVNLSNEDSSSSGDLDARLALVEAVTKSAYDAAVYDLQALLPAEDALGRRALTEKSYGLKDFVIFERTLGSRGAQKEA